MKYDSMRNLPRNKRLKVYAKGARKRGLSWEEIGAQVQHHRV